MDRFLEGKKTSRFQFSVPGLRGIHRNLKQKKIFNSREGFFRKSPFCTFSFWKNWKIAKIALLNPCMKFDFFFGQKYSFDALWKWRKKKYPKHVPGSPKSRIYAGKSTKRGFLKKPSQELKIFICFKFIWIPQRPGTLN